MNAVSQSFITAYARLPAAPPAHRWGAPVAPAKGGRVRASKSIFGEPIYIVDNDPFTVTDVCRQLSDEGYDNLRSFADLQDAQRAIDKRPPGLLLLEVAMKATAGLELLRTIRSQASTERLPVLVLTAAAGGATKRAALDLGATDFLPKPVDSNDLIPRVRNALAVKLYQDRLANQAEQLAAEVMRRTAELEASREEVIHCLGRAAEYRDDVTGRHVIRVGRFAAIIARQMGFSDEWAADLELVAQLHDVGKIGVPDAILNHPGRLNSQMRSVMQNHCDIARGILIPESPTEAGQPPGCNLLGRSVLDNCKSPLLLLAARIAYSHHEWFDGQGYPLGLKGEEIPIEGRITAVADVFDALSSSRPYKPALPLEKCFEILEEERGTHFDPKVLDAFFARREEIIRIRRELVDEE
jgi:putative two-component system response regulator